jgi:hypothetical protein
MNTTLNSLRMIRMHQPILLWLMFMALAWASPLGASILISDGAERNASDDRIEGLSASVSGSTVSVSVQWVADSSGSYTAANGVHLKVFYNSTGAHGAWTEVYSRIYHHDSSRVGDGYVQGTRAMNTVHTDSFTFTASGSGTQYVRASIIDRSSNTDTMTGFYASGSSGTASSSGRHFDNWDVSFFMGCTTPGTPVSLSGSATGTTSANLSWSAGSPGGSPTVTYSWEVRNLSNSTVSSGSTTSTSTTATGLSQGTTYTFRVMATTSCNSTSSSWSSNSSSFTTWTTPTVTTNSTTSDLTATSVTLAGNVTASGGTTVSARGIAWATHSNPTSGTAASSGGTGSFSVNLSGLSPNTPYFYRAYATNSVGTSYGALKAFTTPKAPQTGVTASLAADSIQYGMTTTATASGAQSTGAYEYRRSGGDDCVSFAASGNPRTITGTAVGSTMIEVRRLGDHTYLDSDWVSVGTLTVTPRPLTGSFTVESPKVYDDTIVATVLTRSLSNLASGDNEDASGVYLSGGEATFDTKAVGTDKTVTLTGMTLSGARSANYFLETMNTTLADIIPGPPSMANREPPMQEQGNPQEKVITHRVAGQTLKPIKVRFFDAWGNPVGAGHEVSVSINKGEFASGSLTALTDAEGYAAFGDLHITIADPGYELTFTVTEVAASP